jgi:hypothetical protein
MRARLQKLAQKAVDESEERRTKPHRLAKERTDTAGNPMPAKDKTADDYIGELT